MKSLSIVIPCFNEYTRLYKNLPTLLEYCDTLGDYEIIFVNDGSTDNTLQLLEFYKPYAKNMFVISYVENRGKGYAVRCGLNAATKELVMFMDADLSTDLSCIQTIMTKANFFKKEFVIIGDRESPQSVIKASIFRKTLGRVFVILQYTLLGMKYPDTQCGFKLISKSAVPKITSKLKLDGWAFDVEILYVCKKQHIFVESIPVVWKDVAGSKVRPVRDSWRMFRDLIKIRRLHG